MRVLIVEDDPCTAQVLEILLKRSHMTPSRTDLGDEAIDMAKIYDYDMILLDGDLPDMSGHEVLRQIRTARVTTPVIMVSGHGDIESKLKAFGFGADDYVVKPFGQDELICRIKAIVRRYNGHANKTIEVGDVVLDLDGHEVKVAGRRVHLTGKEYQMLELMALKKGTTVTREQFMDYLYGGLDEPELKIIDVFVCKLRRKLSEAAGGVNYVETIWGRGYRMTGEEAKVLERGKKEEALA